MTKLAIGIDLHRCIGCNTCSIACKMQNNVPDGMLWNRVLTEGVEMFDDAVGVYPNLSRTYLPVACQHCENPACMKVCPTGATYKDEQGRVEIDYDRCIGCRMCMGACPYNARVFNWNEPVRATGFHYGDAGVRFAHAAWPRNAACARSVPIAATSLCACIAARVMLACSATWMIRIRQCRGFGVVAVMCCSRKRARVRKCFT